MNHNKVVKIIEKAGYFVVDEKPLPNGTGMQLILLGHAIVNVYNTGRCVVQGTPSPQDRLKLVALLGENRNPQTG